MERCIFEGFFRLLGLSLIVLIDSYYFNQFYQILNADVYLGFIAISNKILISTPKGEYKAQSDLLSTPLFSARKQFLDLPQNLSAKSRNSKFSIVLATYERPQCFKRVFAHLIKHRPNNTEIIVSDDCSPSNVKRSLLEQIMNDHQKEDVYVIRHKKSFGAFHTKLDGFLFSVGDFIMSIDDDDFFDDQYFIELKETTIKSLSNNENLNFIIALDFPYIKKWIKLPVSLNNMISGFHNHVDFAFRRSLMANVDYPPQNVEIIRDDAPLMIPLYMQSNSSQILYYPNKYKYLVDRLCPSRHQSNTYRSKRRQYLNGYEFLCRYMKSINRTDFGPLVNAAYGIK